MAGRPRDTAAVRAYKSARKTLRRIRLTPKVIDPKWHDKMERYWISRVRHLENIVEAETLAVYGNTYGPRK